MMIFSPLPCRAALFSALLLLLVAACTSSERISEPEAGNAAPAGASSSAAVPDPAHNARNALRYYGSYRGVLPCASCEGIETRLSLFPPQQFRLETRYIGEAGEAQVTEGSFTWNEAGTTITLGDIDADGRPTRYFVAENRLIQLNMQGERVAGELAEAYELQKQTDARQTWNLPLPHAERYVPAAFFGESISVPGPRQHQPDLHFDTEAMRIYGSAGCNRFSAGYEAPGDGKLAFSPIATTKMMCENMELEDRYLAVLRQVAAYHYEPRNRTLLFLDAEGRLIMRLRHESQL